MHHLSNASTTTNGITNLKVSNTSMIIKNFTTENASNINSIFLLAQKSLEMQKLSNKFSSSLRNTENKFIDHLESVLDSCNKTTETCTNFPTNGEKLSPEYETLFKAKLLEVMEKLPNSSSCLGILLNIIGGSFTTNESTTKTHQDHLIALFMEDISKAKELEKSLQSGTLSKKEFRSKQNELNTLTASIKSDLIEHITNSHNTENSEEHIYLNHSALDETVTALKENSPEEVIKTFLMHEENNNTSAHLAGKTNAKAQTN